MRAAARIAALALLFAACFPLHLLAKLLFRHSAWPRRFLGSAAWIIGARVRVDGAPAKQHTLLLSNHVSWLDILVLGGATGCAFVSKDQLGHGFVHWLADQNATVYVNRRDLRGVRDQARAIAGAIGRSAPLSLFPEGTTGPGTRLLPFRSTLLEAVNFAGTQVAVRPVALDYGAAAAEVGWFDDEPGKANVLRLLGRRGTLPVVVRLLAPIARSGDRKQLALDARQAIGEALGFKSPAHSPIGESE
ncbi:MAG: lysophospholipid acyltransferase family protein [Sphingomicrobium sp.]